MQTQNWTPPRRRKRRRAGARARTGARTWVGAGRPAPLLVRPLGGLPPVRLPVRRPSAERALDLALGSVLLALTAPALAAAALVLAARRPPGGIVTRSPRIGLDGRMFVLRTLRTRRLRLDVLSRLPHVVRGDLSLVGPEPLPPEDAPLPGTAPTSTTTTTTAAGAGHWRQTIKPGLIGLAQVRSRSGMPWDEPALLDLHYVEHHGVRLDLAVLAEAARIPLRRAVRGLAGPGKAHLSDTDHRRCGYSAAE
ncbi:sugar transferase [Streptomyces sp. NPDC056061]|uniref:sugar transferase n=1 Tax=Streptomyces sp. NPDC056061 TaxID=3345700 RepID=UPI0035DDF4C9